MNKINLNLISKELKKGKDQILEHKSKQNWKNLFKWPIKIN